MAKRRRDQATVSWNTPVPARLNRAAGVRMVSRGFDSKAEYVRSLIREDVERTAPTRLEEKHKRRERVCTERSHESGEERLDRVLSALRSHKKELCNRGVVRAAVFGSTARGEAEPSSDVDILVDLDPDRSLGVFEFVGIAQYLQEIISGADVVERKALKSLIADRVLEEAIDAF